MAHIPVPKDLPGILSLMAFRPATAGPLSDLAQVLLRGPSPLTPGEREIIAARVSDLNQCRFCCSSHSAAAASLLNNSHVVECVKKDFHTAPISDKLKALLHIAGKVSGDARDVTSDDVAEARRFGASDQEIHDTVLIAAAFCMYNRYVDGLAAWTPSDPAVYRVIGDRLAREGYISGRAMATLGAEGAE